MAGVTAVHTTMTNMSRSQSGSRMPTEFTEELRKTLLIYPVAPDQIRHEDGMNHVGHWQVENREVEDWIDTGLGDDHFDLKDVISLMDTDPITGGSVAVLMKPFKVMVSYGVPVSQQATQCVCFVRVPDLGDPTGYNADYLLKYYAGTWRRIMDKAFRSGCNRINCPIFPHPQLFR